MIQQEGKETLHYELLKEEGPEHAKTFLVEVMLGDQKLGSGSGHSKKAAEQQAAYQALLYRRQENPAK